MIVSIGKKNVRIIQGLMHNINADLFVNFTDRYGENKTILEQQVATFYKEAYADIQAVRQQGRDGLQSNIYDRPLIGDEYSFTVLSEHQIKHGLTKNLKAIASVIIDKEEPLDLQALAISNNLCQIVILAEEKGYKSIVIPFNFGMILDDKEEKIFYKILKDVFEYSTYEIQILEEMNHIKED